MHPFAWGSVLALLVSGSVLLAAPARAHAQAGDFTLPPSGILPNYNRVPIGQREGLEGGAFVARTNDAGAPWYNPAGLILSGKSGLNASANAFELNSVELEGIGREQGGTRFSSIGTYFGGVLGAPVIKSSTWRLGFSYTTPVSWRPSTLDGAFQIPSGTGTESFSYGSSVALVISIPSLAAGFRVNDRFRVGASVGWSITNLAQNQSLSDRLTDPAQSETLTRSFVTDGAANHLLFTGGVQWDLSSRITVGATVTSPGVRIGGSSKVNYSLTQFSGAGSRQIGFRDTEAEFEYKVPFKAVVGVGLDVGRGEVEGDVRYYGGNDRYAMFTSDELASLVITDANGVPTQSTLTFAPVTEAARSVVNVAISGNYPLSNAWRVHLGFFTDRSPVKDQANSMFRSVDLVGLSTGVSFGFEHLSGSLGVMWSGGTTDEREIGPSLGGATAVTRIKVQTFNLLYALSYKF